MSDTITEKITILGLTFNSEEERRTYFREELRKKLPELKKMEGFPIGEDEDILNLSDPPFYTACPNPWLNDFISQWENEKAQLEKEGKREKDFQIEEPFANDISEGKNNPFYSLHTYHTKVPHPAIMRYLLHYTQPGDIVFDGFAGTGMTGVAAALCETADYKLKIRLTQEFKEKNGYEPNWGKRNSILSDLSPAASFISSNLNDSYNTNEVKESIIKKLGVLYEKYKWMFVTRHSDGNEGVINFVVWSEVVSCPDCNREFSLWESSADTDNGRMKSEFNCPNCEKLLSKSVCNSVLNSVIDEGNDSVVKQKEYRPVLINYSCRKKRYFKIPDSEDKILIKKVDQEKIENWYPTEKIMMKGENWGDTWRAGVHNGTTRVHHFYTKRNLLIISELWKALNNHEKFVATSVLSRNLTKLNRYVLKPRTPHGEVNGPLSGTLYLSSEFVEQNPFDLLKSKIPKFSWDNKGSVTSVCAAQNSSIQNDSVDYIFTDPPFGANLMYSELNFLWEAWLKVFTDNKLEAIENNSQNKSTLIYQYLMLDCFKEYFRILKPNKWMTVEFSNTSAAVWNGIQTALTNAGFIISNVSALDKKHGGIKSMTYSTAVKEDLIISCYKPSISFEENFKKHENIELGVWDFVEEHIHHLPIHVVSENATTAIIERSPRIIYDRLIKFYFMRGLVPIDSIHFQNGLKERYAEKDGMVFTQEQLLEYEKKKSSIPKFIQFNLFVTNEEDSIYWLKAALTKSKQTEQDLYPLWMKEVVSSIKKGDILPEMRTILEENFLKDKDGKWYIPDSENEADLEKLRNKRLLKQFDGYKIEASKPKSKIKEVRVEALRAGFKQCYQDKDFKTIVQIGDRIPNNLLMEDEVLLQFYDIASSRV